MLSVQELMVDLMWGLAAESRVETLVIVVQPYASSAAVREFDAKHCDLIDTSSA